MTYLITFACYGCHLHGDEAGSVDRNHNVHGGRLVDANQRRHELKLAQMDQPPYSMDEPRRTAVLSAMIDRCAHVRTNHIHLVIDSDATPERVMNDLKSFASRRLNELGLDGADRKRWARHGSTRYLWKREDMPAALSYVLDKQGEQMAVYSAPEP